MATLPRISTFFEPDLTGWERPLSVSAPSHDASQASDVAAARCDREALLAMYGTLAPRVHRFLRDLLGDAALASDATQETFVRALRRVDTLSPDTRLVPWVFGVARFVAIELRKTRARQRRTFDDAPPDEARTIATDGRTPETKALDREAMIVVESALGQLSEGRRTALLLRCDHDLSYDEIAPIMGWSLAKVKIEIFRARETLRATFEAYRTGKVTSVGEGGGS